MRNSNIFNDLATLSEAGISNLEAARRVADSYPEIKAWPGVVKKLSIGNKLSLALNKSGLISPFEKEIIAASEFAGRTPQGLRWIATCYDKRRQRVSRLKTKLYLPVAILMIAIIISSITNLVSNTQSWILIIINTLALLALVILITRAILIFLKKDSSNFFNYAASFRDSKFYKHLFEQIVFGALLWQIKSGVNFKTGFSKIARILKSRPLKDKLLLVSRNCGNGMSVVDSVIKAKLPITNDFTQILNAAEASGNWESAVENYLQHQSVLLDLQINHAFDWAPRFVYMAAVIVTISVIF